MKTLQKYIRKILNEETEIDQSSSFKNKINLLLKTEGVEYASESVNGFDNLVRILDLDIDNVNTQEMLVKNFIYHTNYEGIYLSHISVKTYSDGNHKVLKVYFKTNSTAYNIDTWYARTLCDDMKKLFNFKVEPSWEPMFAARGVKIFLDSEVIDGDNLQEQISRIQSMMGVINESSEITDDVVGKEFWFEYHCFESPKSCDAELWYRTHNKVLVLSIVELGCGETKLERLLEGCPRVYRVVFEDGFEYDVFEDELMESKEKFERPDAPKRNLQ